MRIASHFAAWCGARSCSYLQGQRTHGALAKLPPLTADRVSGALGVGRSRRHIDGFAVAQVNKMKLVLALAVGASAFGGFGKSAAPAPSRGGQVAQGGQTVTNIQVPKIFTTAFGDPGRLQERAARAEAKKAEAEAQLIPTPARFAFAFGRPDILAERRAERLAKWQWSDEFLAKARPDQGNYGQGDVYDDGLTKLERAQIEQAATGARHTRRRQAPVQAPHGPIWCRAA